MKKIRMQRIMGFIFIFIMGVLCLSCHSGTSVREAEKTAIHDTLVWVAGDAGLQDETLPGLNYILPREFGYVHDVIPDVRYDIRYFGHDNFLGTPVNGYLESTAILTLEALHALKGAADNLRRQGYGIIVFDAYRPQRAVDHFVSWAKRLDDTLTKQKYYPEVNKAQLFSLGYIASRSSHSRGSTIDLSLYILETGEEVDMGSGFDFFGPVSNHNNHLITPEQQQNRAVLLREMIANGFMPYPEEWWHYTLRKEPYPDTYFDFDVF